MLAAAALLALSAPAFALCNGTDLFPEIAHAAPAEFAALQASAHAMAFAHGRLYSIDKGGRRKSYVFGTLHMSDPRLAGIAEPAERAISDSKVVAFELKEVGTKLRLTPALLGAVRAEEGSHAPDLLDPPAFEKLTAMVAARGYPVRSASTLRATVLALMLDTPKCAMGDRDGSLDAVLARFARAEGKPVIGLETVVEQVQALDGLSRSDQAALLRAVLAQDARTADVNETVVTRYRNEDLGALVVWMSARDPIPGVRDAAPPATFIERLLRFRTRRMKERVEPLLRDGGAFIAVGAAHLPGPTGLLELLRKDGYAIERLE